MNERGWGKARVGLLLSWLVVGCVDPVDVLGLQEVVTETKGEEPLEDDRLSDKRPEYDPERTVVEELDGCRVTLNKSASVTRLTLQSKGELDSALRGKIFRSRSAAMAALDGAPTLPTTEVVNGALKPFNDGLYAAVELAAERGDASLVNKRQLLHDLLTELSSRSQQGDGLERGPALAGAKHLAAAFVLAGESEAVSSSLVEGATRAAAEFERQGIYSKPIGFYTWTPELSAIFKRDRWLQRRHVPGAGMGTDSNSLFAALAGLGRVVGRAGPLTDAYARSLDLYRGITDPFFDASPFELSSFVTDPAALSDLSAVERRFAATLPAAFEAPRCNPGLAAFPASESAENRILRKLLCGGELGAGETLIDGLIRSIQAGQLDLAPRAGAGFYDQQLYALETLLLPDRAPESQHLLLTRAYKEKLVETFKSLLIQTRETHVKQVGLVDAATSSFEIPREFTAYPKLVVEPFPTFYLRTARAYRFLQGVLEASLGPDFLTSTARVVEDGTRAPRLLAEELADKQQLLYGLHALSADSIGMAPTLAADEVELFPLEAARQSALEWLANVGNDPDVARDPRVALPVALEIDPETNVDYAIYWAVVGVKVLHLHASFPESHRPEIVDDDRCTQKGWTTFEPYLLVEQTIQARRPLALPPLTRDEFRALCDRHDTAEAIAEAFASAP